MTPHSSLPRRRVDLAKVAEDQGALIRRVPTQYAQKRLFHELLGSTGEVEAAAHAAEIAANTPAGGRRELTFLADRLAEAHQLAELLAQAA